MTSDPALVLLDLALILLTGALLKPVMRKLRQPAVIAEILGGIALGPSLLGLLPGDLPALLFPASARTGLSAIAQVAIALFMFLIGWEVDLGRMRTRTSEVLRTSLAAIVVPFAAGTGLACWLFTHHSHVDGDRVGLAAFVLFVGTAMAITAFPVLARIIVDHELQRTPVGMLALASAAVGDLLAWCMLVLVSAVAASAGLGQLGTVLALSLLFGAVLALVGRPLLRYATDHMTRTAGRASYLLPLIGAGLLTAGYTAHEIGLDAIFGAFAFGLIMPRGSRTAALHTRIAVPLKHITDLLLPVFFITTGLSVDLARLGSTGLIEVAAIIAVACLGKLGGTVGAARTLGMSWRDSTTLGFLMNTRGLTELIILNAGMRLGILDQQMFTMMVCMAIVTTGMAGYFIPRPAPPAAPPPSDDASPSRPAPQPAACTDSPRSRPAARPTAPPAASASTRS
ncbi:cation:proton antiporter [Streptomyces sp. ASQP_92]|uniref:cation:proton antiporter domain-containing protein n=1 Tax=Streptomyces sp. ASQP_92 TaxID=2979116 RepID=UPI0021BE8780|nr:cation:proton antiporter [Streptomyces sp. ASQP_92]MCT9089965.1 cation:proton antiporter [Streptomyces sp. ASQP_92]